MTQEQLEQGITIKVQIDTYKSKLEYYKNTLDLVEKQLNKEHRKIDILGLPCDEVTKEFLERQIDITSLCVEQLERNLDKL